MAIEMETVEKLLSACRRRNLKIVTAESCTGGLIAGALTAVSGASDVFDRGFVTYANEAKTDMLGVPAELIADQGAVAEDVARAMAEGALQGEPNRCSVAVTGIAGPGGGTADKPVGLVHLAVSGPFGTHHEVQLFAGDRKAVREATVAAALDLLAEQVATLP
ncbi:MAG: CinA family protein [Magnetovibrionaceae bacterium]